MPAVAALVEKVLVCNAFDNFPSIHKSFINRINFMRFYFFLSATKFIEIEFTQWRVFLAVNRSPINT